MCRQLLDQLLRIAQRVQMRVVDAGNAVEYLAAGALLDEAGELAAINVEALPV